MSTVDVSLALPGPRGHWKVHKVDREDVVFESPGGRHYVATCVNGRFDYELSWAFLEIEQKPITRGVLHHSSVPSLYWAKPKNWFSIHFDDTRVGSALSQSGFHGFTIRTPAGHRLEMRFVRETPPLAFAEILRGIFDDPAKGASHAEGKLAHQPVPEEPATQHGEGQGRPGEGRQESGRERQERGQRLAGKDPVQQVVQKLQSRRIITPQRDGRSRKQPPQDDLVQEFLGRKAKLRKSGPPA